MGKVSAHHAHVTVPITDSLWVKYTGQCRGILA